ncbi:hypothetical protein DL764_005871 [Monosporascus ibericus]|uniref:Uncharacterized protein n=1 Tax=Monosporascus ibericus TaxID=155417 RepID=A0A4Q4T9S9_9PEZI|nr:hypothetical protein DL764_005871 [Monosporascus ibericus]
MRRFLLNHAVSSEQIQEESRLCFSDFQVNDWLSEEGVRMTEVMQDLRDASHNHVQFDPASANAEETTSFPGVATYLTPFDQTQAKPQPIAKPATNIVEEQQTSPRKQVCPTPANPKPVAGVKRKQTSPKVPITRPILRREATTETLSMEPERIASKPPVMSPKHITAEIATQSPDTVSAGTKTRIQDLLRGSEPDTIPITVSPLAYSPTKPLAVDAATQTPEPVTVSRPALSSATLQGGVRATQRPTTVVVDPVPVLPNLVQGSEPDTIPIPLSPSTLAPAHEERPMCTAIAQYHSCGCQARGTPMFFCTDQYCKHSQPALVAIARLSFSCTTRYSGNVRPGTGCGLECRAADPNSVFFTREADTAGAFYADDLLVLRGRAVRLRDLPSMLPGGKF